MLGQFDFNVIERSIGYLFREGMTFTLTLTALAVTGGIVFGTLLAMMRLSSFKPLAAVAGAYVNVMRSVPLVLVIFWFYFLVPYIGAWIVRSSQPIQVGAFYSSLITFTLFEAAYYCEIMRAGIQSVSRGQVWAGYALGLNYWQTMGRIVLPQAFRNMLPILLTQSIILGARLFHHLLRGVVPREAAAAAHRDRPLILPIRLTIRETRKAPCR